MYEIRRPPGQNFFCSLSPSWIVECRLNQNEPDIIENYVFYYNRVHVIHWLMLTLLMLFIFL